MCFPLILRTIIYFHVYIILDFLITYRNASVFCQSEGSCLHKTTNIAVFFVKSNENAYPKGRALMQMYRVVPQTTRGNYQLGEALPTEPLRRNLVIKL